MGLPENEMRLDEAALARLLDAGAWRRAGNAITRTFMFKGFKGAMAFANRVADAANAANHHPDIHIEGYRTVRIVLWTNEENGGRGGRAYRDTHLSELPKHVMMLEADSGLFPPVSFGISANGRAQATVTAIATLLAGISADRVTQGGGGADIEPSLQAGRMPGMSYDGSGNYFLIHHTQADTVDKIDPIDVSRASAAIAVMAYVIAEMPARLGE